MNLIIVESPTKARTLSRYLKGKYNVEASIGHIRDLPKSELGVDVEKNFKPRYVIPLDKRKRVGELKDIAKKADKIILATDPDREGEAIAWHVARVLEDAGDKRPFERIVFHEITEEAIKHALTEPRSIDMKLVDAQQARRVLDRLVGYKLSPLLWQKLSKRWLSAGRVQSVAVRLIVEREREIEKFEKLEYWTIDGTFKGDTFKGDEVLLAGLIGKNGDKYESTLSFDLFDGTYTVTKTSVTTQEQAEQIIRDITSPFTISAVDTKEVKRYPAAPYTTSTLQQDAGRKMYFSSKKTMQLAQKLYEEGHITYHRTDSVNLSEKFVTEARKYIEKEYGREYIPDSPKQYQTKSKVAQEAHEAIRPTNIGIHGHDLAGQNEFHRDHIRLYELIWKRAVASQAKEAVFDATTIEIKSSNEYIFGAKGSVIKFEGFLKIVGRDSEEKVIPKVSVGDTVTLVQATPTQHFTNPPPRYTEAGLVKTLEEKDIGRPSTYAPIISTIQDRQYVTREEKKLKPTDLGFAVTDFLVQYFPNVLNLPFTATMEEQLDKIAIGETAWEPVIAEFYGTFAKDLDASYELAEKVKVTEEATGEKCPDCGNPLVVRMGRYGKFVACSTFPKCKFTKPLIQKLDMKCPRCAGDIVVKKTRSGKTFYGCSNYPTCTFAAWKKEDIK